VVCTRYKLCNLSPKCRLEKNLKLLRMQEFSNPT
jgi:hypothetical protein